MEDRICFNCKHLKSRGFSIGCELDNEDKKLSDTCDNFEYEDEIVNKK